MAILLDKCKVVLGRIIRVYNTDKPKFSNAKKVYYAIQVEDASGDNEQCLLFTKNELDRAAYRASRNVEDQTTKSWWTDLND